MASSATFEVQGGMSHDQHGLPMAAGGLQASHGILEDASQRSDVSPFTNSISDANTTQATNGHQGLLDFPEDVNHVVENGTSAQNLQDASTPLDDGHNNQDNAEPTTALSREEQLEKRNKKLEADLIKKDATITKLKKDMRKLKTQLEKAKSAIAQSKSIPAKSKAVCPSKPSSRSAHLETRSENSNSMLSASNASTSSAVFDPTTSERQLKTQLAGILSTVAQLNKRVKNPPNYAINSGSDSDDTELNGSASDSQDFGDDLSADDDGESSAASKSAEPNQELTEGEPSTTKPKEGRRVATRRQRKNRKVSYKCDFPGCVRKPCHSQRDLDKHKAIHNPGHKAKGRPKGSTNRNKPIHKCEVCEKIFKKSRELKMHSYVHTGEKPLACRFDGCERAFIQSSQRDYHERVHVGFKPFLCETCGKAFTGKPKLTMHERIHTGEKPYQCDQCLKRFTRSEYLLKHRKSNPTCAIGSTNGTGSASGRGRPAKATRDFQKEIRSAALRLEELNQINEPMVNVSCQYGDNSVINHGSSHQVIIPQMQNVHLHQGPSSIAFNPNDPNVQAALQFNHNHHHNAHLVMGEYNFNPF